MANSAVRGLLASFTPQALGVWLSEHGLQFISDLTTFRAWSDSLYIPGAVYLLSTGTLYFRDDDSTAADDGAGTIWITTSLGGRRVRYTRFGSGGGAGGGSTGPQVNYVQQGNANAIDIATNTADIIYVGITRTTASIALPRPGIGGRTARRPSLVILLPSLASRVTITRQGGDTVDNGTITTAASRTFDVSLGSQWMVTNSGESAANAVWRADDWSDLLPTPNNLPRLMNASITTENGIGHRVVGNKLILSGSDIEARTLITTIESTPARINNTALSNDRHYVIDGARSGNSFTVSLPSGSPVGTIIALTRNDADTGLMINRGSDELMTYNGLLITGSAASLSSFGSGRTVILTKSSVNRWHYSDRIGQAFLSYDIMLELMEQANIRGDMAFLGNIRQWVSGTEYEANELVWTSDGDTTSFWRAKRTTVLTTSAPGANDDWEPAGGTGAASTVTTGGGRGYTETADLNINAADLAFDNDNQTHTGYLRKVLNVVYNSSAERTLTFSPTFGVAGDYMLVVNAGTQSFNAASLQSGGAVSAFDLHPRDSIEVLKIGPNWTVLDGFIQGGRIQTNTTFNGGNLTSTRFLNTNVINRGGLSTVTIAPGFGASGDEIRIENGNTDATHLVTVAVTGLLTVVLRIGESIWLRKIGGAWKDFTGVREGNIVFDKWEPRRAYKAGQTVTSSNGLILYLCILAHTSPASFPTDSELATNWRLIELRNPVQGMDATLSNSNARATLPSGYNSDFKWCEIVISATGGTGQIYTVIPTGRLALNDFTGDNSLRLNGGARVAWTRSNLQFNISGANQSGFQLVRLFN